MDKIKIRGARANNLKNINLDIPRNKMVVMTGLSGSGKSSLAFDTIYAEGQRRYVESLSSYARQFLGQMDKPDVDSVDGLSPSISIDQKTTNRNPRSTVGTVTEIYDYMRLLFAKVGKPYCPVCHSKIEAVPIDSIVDQVMSWEKDTKFYVLAPIVKSKKGQHKKIIDEIDKEGFSRLQIDGKFYEIDEDINLDKNFKHDIDIVVDRLKLKDNINFRLTDAIETALKYTEGTVVIQTFDGKRYTFSTTLACKNGHISIEGIEPRLFSFNSPFGACPECSGLGFHLAPDINLMIPNMNLSISEGAILPYKSGTKGSYYYELIKCLAKKHNFSLDEPISKAPNEFMNELIYGTSDIFNFVYDSRFSGKKKNTNSWEGMLANIEERFYDKSSSNATTQRLSEFMSERTCKVCSGDRLKKEALTVKLGGLNIAEVTKLSVKKARDFFDSLEFSESESIIANPILKEICSRLEFLINVGLDYLSLNRYAASLSGGESQRIRLATQIGAGLVGVIYVLDEPSIGLHQRDNDRLIQSLRGLTDLGNTLIIVEHDEDTMRAADWIVDVGPEAGIYGGEIVCSGSYKDIIDNTKSITANYLAHRDYIRVPKKRRLSNNFIKIKGARQNNLKSIDVDIPKGVFTCITGVSGSGKSSLTEEILYKGLAFKVNNERVHIGEVDSITGYEDIDKVVQIDQTPIGRTPRSNPGTYTKVFNDIRKVFANTSEAKLRGYNESRFSFNLKSGRCEACKGDGTIKVEMHFLPDVYVPCEVCNGKRYNRETLQIKFKGKNISEVLDMTIDEGISFFENHPNIKRKLETLRDVGLGYIKIGQPSPSLSGGEAQRVKLASELGKKLSGKNIYILDEPTTGLHVHDVKKLIDVLQKLTDAGNTVVVIEHNLDVIKCADYIIDLGPEGGDNGGEVVGFGTPEELVNNKKSYTGKYLKPILERDK